jgi:hypothetical protein
MYYEERWIDGKLMYRTTPMGVWLVVTDKQKIIRHLMAQLTDTQRLEIINNYCKHCGGDPKCTCMRDD